jgi:hypothetical protein
VKLWTVVAIIVVVDLLAVGILLLIRRHGPADGWFRDSQQAAGAFTVTGTIFAVLVGFVFLLAFGSYSSARASSSDEGLAALSLYHVAERFPDAEREGLQSDVACYGRAVVADEWPAMSDHETSDLVDRWETSMDADFYAFAPQDTLQEDAAQNWFNESDALRQARQERIAEAPRFVPGSIWVLLLLVGVAVIGFALLFADGRERRTSQIALVVAVTTAVTASLLIVNFLDRPFGEHEGAIKPTAMRTALNAMQRDLVPGDRAIVPLCDGGGQPAASGGASAS